MSNLKCSLSKKISVKREIKRASYLHRTATTDYPCFRQDLGDSSGAGRVRLARLQYYDIPRKCTWSKIETFHAIREFLVFCQPFNALIKDICP